MKKLFPRFVVAVIFTCCLTAAQAVEYTINSFGVSSELSGWPAANAIDGNVASSWSSVGHASSNYTENCTFYWSQGLQSTNYVRLTPRWASNQTMGFPVSFTVYYSNGSSWVAARTISNLQKPYRNADIILAFPSTVTANGIRIVATVLGSDSYNNYYFQLAEAHAGYDAGFNHMVYVSNNGANRVEVRGVTAGAYNPNKISNWNPDDRYPIIAPNTGTFRNIYAPSIQQNGGAYNIIFGGWDGSSIQNDELSEVVTSDNFQSFSTHNKVITHGTLQHVNNPSMLRINSTTWKLAYTTLAYGGLNKPGYATSANGLNWTPSSGSASYLMSMAGYSGWSNADVNGGNAIYYDGTTYHMYFDNFSDMGVHYATSTNNQSYTYQGKIASHGYVVQDIKSWVVSGTRYYMTVYHANGTSLVYSVSTSLSSPGSLYTMFNYDGATDRYITSAGMINNGTGLVGCFYGASSNSNLMSNQIFVKWLQKKVLFLNTSVGLGVGEKGHGPDKLYLSMVSGQNVETGQFHVYDTDGSTTLFDAPYATLINGDIWQYVP